MPGSVWVVIPTYNEAENVRLIVAAVLESLTPVAAGGLRVLVVDDGSPDGTGRIADAMAAADSRIDVLHRETKEGLGPAYVAGFRAALAGGADYIFELDADFSHDPGDLPRLLAAAREGADLVLGSRYVEGGGVTEWHWLRRAVSRGGCWYARRMLGVRVRDLTGGFKCFRADTLRSIDYETVGAHGYAFQVELTYRALRRELAVVELPIIFHERREGESKMSGAIAIEAFWRVPLLRVRRQSR
jgi:dolichol-phosphate mannosyltransferase